MTTASPRGSRKFVYVVMLDPPTRRVLLVRNGPAADACWGVPKVTVRPGADYRSAAVRFVRRRRKLQPVRIASVTGRLFAIDDAAKPGYVVLVLPEAGRWKDRPGRMLGPAARWWAVNTLKTERLCLQPPQLLDLVDGYWDGWLPDGEVSLV